MFYPSTGLFIARDSRFCLAVKAGDNDDSHNHNDTGSFTIYKDGKPLFADIGVETYQAKTFSPQRYEIWTMQSAYHNLPPLSPQTAMNKWNTTVRILKRNM
ncbi:MAG: heparinase II/III family protein [Clostridium sp.]